MRVGAPLVLAGLAVFFLCFSSPAPAAVPAQVNYQVMLTDDADNPISNDTLPVTFRVFDDPDAGTQLWDEAHSVETNGIGVATVILGETSPLDGLDFNQPLWLEVVVDGQVMSPRRAFLAVPYAMQAVNASELGGTAAGEYLTEAESGASGAINAPDNPLDWTMLKSVPAGFADGVDDAGGAGDGHSLDASDGSPTDVVRVSPYGTVYVGTGHGSYPDSSLIRANGGDWGSAAAFENTGYDHSRPAVYARSDSGVTILGNVRHPAGVISTTGYSVGVCGVSNGDALGGYFYSWDSGDGLQASAGGTGDAFESNASSGRSGRFKGGSGVSVEVSDATPALLVENKRTSDWGDAGTFKSEPGVDALTWTLQSYCYQGRAGHFKKQVDDNEYTLAVFGYDSTSEGLYVSGTITSTSPLARAVETTRGTEPVFGVSSPDVEVMDRGRATLTDGRARVTFDRTFAEAVSGPEDLTVTATPIGAWSALYVEKLDAGGFTVRTGAGEENVEFHWVAVGRSRGHEERPSVVFLNAEENERIAARKRAVMESRGVNNNGDPGEMNVRTPR